MAREKEAYRDNLELLMQRFPGKSALNQSEVARYLGRDRRTVAKKYSFDKKKKGCRSTISIVVLARELS